MTDDLGFSDIGPYGGEIVTPHLDQLGQRDAHTWKTRAVMPINRSPN